MNDELVVVTVDGLVGIIQLNRPDKLNALSPQMLRALCKSAEELDADELIRVIVIAGSQRVFAAGADIEAMAQASSQDVAEINTRQFWLRLRALTKPVIAAVSGYAYGGGCELAMQCDLIVASESAKFAQPEIRLGIMPGAGGTQRLTKAIGPYKAMEMVLTGEPIDARKAFEYNLVNRVVPVELYLAAAVELAHTIAQRPPIAVRMAREALRAGVETTLDEGMAVERQNFVALFDTQDQAEGMGAFLEKRPPRFQGK